MPKDTGARLFAGALRNFTRNDFAHPAEPKFAILRLAHDLLAVFWFRAFCHDNQRAEIAGGIARFDRSRNSVVIKRDLRNQNDIRAPGNSTMQCDPAGMASHDFHNHDALVARGTGVQSVERIHYHGNRGIEAESHRCRFKIIVDRFRDADAIDTRLLQLLRGDHRTVSPYNDQSFHAELIQNPPGMLDYFCRNDGALACADFGDKMATVGGTDDCASQGHDSINALPIENHVIAGWKKSFESITKTDHLPPKPFRCEHHSAQDRIQSRAIATAGQNANPWLHFRARSIRAVFLSRQDGRWRPTDRRVATRVVQAPHPHRIGLCCRAAPRSNDADTQLSPCLGSRPLARDWSLE